MVKAKPRNSKVTKAQALAMGKKAPDDHFAQMGGYPEAIKLYDSAHAFHLWDYARLYARDKETDNANYWWYEYYFFLNNAEKKRPIKNG